MGKKSVCIVVLIILALVCVACSSKPAYPPYAEEVCGMLGQDLESVLTQLGLSINDFEYDEGSYWYNNSVEFEGYSFRMRITPYRTDSQNLVQGIGYVIQCSDGPENAADAVLALKKILEKGKGTLVEPNPSGNNQLPLKVLERAELAQKLTETGWTAGLTWILSTDLDAIPSEIIVDFSPTCISLRYWIGCPNIGEEAESETVVISMDYGLTTDYVAQD